MTQLQPVFPHLRRDHPVSLHGSHGLYAPGPTEDEVVPSSRPRLLLVEDDPAMRAMLTDVLSCHYRIESVSDGLAAWQVVHHDPPAMVIVDLRAPGKDSLILIRSLREGTSGGELPIILLTVGADRELLLRCLAAGASNFLLKPFGMAEFLAFIRVELELQNTLAGARKGRAMLRGSCA